MPKPRGYTWPGLGTTGLTFTELSHPWGLGVPNWPYFEDVKIERVHYMAKSGVLTQRITTVMHSGTHIDAPRHFGKDATPINEYPLENCIVKGICIDLRHIAPKAEITPKDLEDAVKKAGVPVPKKGTVLLCTGHHERTFPRKEYATDNSGVNVAATEWLAKQGIEPRPLAPEQMNKMLAADFEHVAKIVRIAGAKED